MQTPQPCDHPNASINNECGSNVISFPFGKQDTLSARLDYNFDLYAGSHKHRQAAEQFIQQGFLKTYGANIAVTMPMLLSIKKNAFKAALGLRQATQPLFIEQYLDAPIEQSLSLQGIQEPRKRITEVGHLYSNHSRFALPLLLTTGMSLFIAGQNIIVFCATHQVKNLIAEAGITLTTLCQAEEEKLCHHNEQWGSYYQTSPSVVAIATSDICQAVVANKRYFALFKMLSARIQTISGQLSEWLQ